MEAGKIVVLILTLFALGLLIAAEINSRRNTRALKEAGQNQTPDAKR